MILPTLLMGAGLLLIIAEILIPSFGVLGGASALCLVAAVVLGYQVDSTVGTGFLIAAIVLVPAMILLGLKILPRGPFAKHLVAPGPSFEDGRVVDPRAVGLEGHEGVVESPLRPSGTARIDGRRIDVVSRGEMIEVGARVRVLEVKGNRVVVARVPEETDPGARS